MDSTSMRLQLPFRVKAGSAFRSIIVYNFAIERLSPSVDGQSVFLQCRMLPKGLVTTSSCTFELLPALMSSVMPLQSRCRNEAFATAFPLTYVVTDIGMRGFDVVLQMRFAEEILRAQYVRTHEWSSVGVRSNVLS